jgi:hypothetical protein
LAFFWGIEWVYVLPLLHRQIPYVTLHTILDARSGKGDLEEICKMADKVVVMSQKAISFLTTIYDVSLKNRSNRTQVRYSFLIERFTGEFKLTKKKKKSS